MTHDLLALAERLRQHAVREANELEDDLLEASAALWEAHAKLTNCQNKLKASGRYKLREENERLRALLLMAKERK